MNSGKGRLALALVVLAVVAAAVWWALPRLPGRVRHYLPAPLAALVTTPLPTALPAPTGAPAAAELALRLRAVGGRADKALALAWFEKALAEGDARAAAMIQELRGDLAGAARLGLL